MSRNNRGGVEYPKKYMKLMKKVKKRRIRHAKLDKIIIEQEYNNAEREL